MPYTPLIPAIVLAILGGHPLLGGSFAGSFPDYTFEAFCEDPAGEIIIIGVTTCTAINISYLAPGSSSVFDNAELTFATLLDPALPDPFPFSGSWLLKNLDDPSQTLFGTLKGRGVIAGPPGPPIGFPPFAIQALLVTTGGTGPYAGASGMSRMKGSANFTFLTIDGTFGSGVGTMAVAPVPEPATGSLLVMALVLGAGWCRSKSRAM
jgi:hypothetical protein